MGQVNQNTSASVLAINLFCDVLVLVLVLLQTTYVLWVYFVYNSWVVWSEHRATNNREYSRVHRFPGLLLTQLSQYLFAQRAKNSAFLTIGWPWPFLCNVKGILTKKDFLPNRFFWSKYQNFWDWNWDTFSRMRLICLPRFLRLRLVLTKIF